MEHDTDEVPVDEPGDDWENVDDVTGEPYDDEEDDE